MSTFQQLNAPITGITVDDSACEVDDLAYCGGIVVKIGPDQSWDALVERAVESDWRGIEALSGIEGSVGDVVTRNASAYSYSVADAVYSVRTWDHSRDAQKTFPMVSCQFGTGESRFQEELPGGGPRFEILDVSFLFKQGDYTLPIQDEELAAMLGIAVGDRATLKAVRDTILNR